MAIGMKPRIIFWVLPDLEMTSTLSRSIYSIKIYFEMREQKFLEAFDE